eukprot:gnl/MRDRNA2_/MRDRNA2_94639_c0_seq1.p1 gnl/MRDRNA2_/MRDRNA2_94639_c0~~gnl/MRDRNA2_/MRDRNA2_94639_c0_seq1.p1  ORF type:complete len:321 (+),score=50.61 gnl/MRDRNA2_/MRDRNA2_94639_c0_seq1:93-965(+)
MAFGVATSGISTKTNTWTTASVRSNSLRRNNAGRSVGAAVAATCKNKLAMKSTQNTAKLTPFSNQAFSDASTMLSDDNMASSRSSTASIADQILLSAPGQFERCGSSSSSSTGDESLLGSVGSSFEGSGSSSSSTCDGSLPGSLCAGEEGQQPMMRRERGSTIKRRPRPPDHLRRISCGLATAADFNALAVSRAFEGADKDRDGVLTMSDMQDVFQYFGLPSEDAIIFVNLMDTHGSGTLYWREIVAILAPLFKEVQPKQDFAALSIHFKKEIMKDDDDPQKIKGAFSWS